MANSEAAESEEYEQLVEDLENELGREICGAPTGSGSPCRKWPVDGGDGFCRTHASGTDEDVTTSGEDGDKVNLTSAPEDDSGPLPTGLPGLLLLALLGVVLGAGVTSAAVYFYQKKPSDLKNNFSPTSANQLDVDLSKPDFSKVQKFLQQGKLARIAAFLQRVLDESENSEARARAAYLLFVFYQQQGEYQRALELTEEIRNKYPDFSRLPEVIYGAWYLSKNQLEDDARARRYRDLLKSEFPDSKWADELP